MGEGRREGENDCTNDRERGEKRREASNQKYRNRKWKEEGEEDR